MKERNILGHLEEDGMIILNWILNKLNVGWFHMAHDRA
jgi:hypothetical protein